MMTRKNLEKAISRIELPDAREISPEELVLKYSYLLKFFGVNKLPEMLIFTDTVEDIMKKDSERYISERNRILNSITDPNCKNIYVNFEENEEKEKKTKNSLLPFAYYLRRMTDQMTRDEKSYKKLTVDECLQIADHILRKYQIYGFCNSIMTVDTVKDHYTVINGDLDSLLSMLAATIQGYIEESTESSLENLDRFLLRLAEKQQNNSTQNCRVSANISCVTPSINQKRHSIIEQLKDVMEDDIQTVKMILKCVLEKNGTYLVCVQLINDVRFVAGGTEEDMENMISQIIAIIIEKSRMHSEISFNQIAREIRHKIITNKKTHGPGEGMKEYEEVNT